jgi:hypothetical protein
VQQLEQENASLERDLSTQKRDLSDTVEEQQAAADKMGRMLQGEASVSSWAVVCVPTTPPANVVACLSAVTSLYTDCVCLLRALHSLSSCVCCTADLQLVFADFELDLEATLPQHWQQLTQGSASDASSVSPHSIKLRSRLLSLLSARNGSHKSGTGGGNSSSSRGGASAGNGSHQGSPCQHGRTQAASSNNSSSRGVDPSLPSSWAGKLQAVVEVLELAGQERGHALGEWEAAQQRVQLLETNVQEVGPLLEAGRMSGRQLAAVV